MTKQVVKRNYSKINTLLNNAGLFRQLPLLYWNKMMIFIIIIFFFNSKFENTFCLSPFGRCPSACCIVFLLLSIFCVVLVSRLSSVPKLLVLPPIILFLPQPFPLSGSFISSFSFSEVGAHVSQLDAFRRFVLRLGSKLSAIKETKRKITKLCDSLFPNSSNF